MPTAVKERWEDWFDQDETLLWEGAPKVGTTHWVRNIFFSAFGIPFLGAGIGSAASAFGHLVSFSIGDLAIGIFLALFSVPFIGAGAAMVFGGWMSDYYVPRRTRYALTTKAGYVATRYWGRNMDVVPVSKNVRIELIEHRNGTATVFFHFEKTRDSDGDLRTTMKGFREIEDGDKVYRLLRDLQAKKGKTDA